MSDKLTLPKDVEAQAYLAAIIASSDDAIISKDLNGNITSWNPAAERIFGYTPEDIIGRHISILIPPENLDEEDYIIGKIRRGERIEHFETSRRRKDGSPVNISVTVSPIKNSDGKIIGASKIARDITDRMASEKALRESNLKKDEFLANMSHELRTPMNAVIGLSSILKKTENLPERAQKYIETLSSSASHMMDLINDLLDFAKIEAGSFQIEDIEFDLPEQIEKVISVANVKAKEKNIGLYIDYVSDLNRHYMGDPLRIHQILSNLVSNAIKFTDTGSVTIDISGRVDEATDTTFVTMRVSDTGIGIADEKIKTIFDKFTQADASITRRFGGSGLGLAIVKACVEQMKGTISLNSQVGVGSVFTVTLPLKNVEKTSAIEGFSVGTAPAVPEHKKNILLVEDYEPNIIVARAFLDEFEYDYDVATNGFEALRKFVNGRYDVVLMDIQMNELDGLEATRRIRKMEQDKALSRTPIIAMTAHVREQDKNQALAAGMDDFITKPFDGGILKQKIKRYVA